MGKWRNELDPLINARLNDIVKETKEFSSAMKLSKDPSKAQLWVAIAVLFDKVKHLEATVTALQKGKKIPHDELDKILKTIEKL